ncbi:hypothetical protein BpHYR1_026821 [Brachionus plicatilis]|uniref:Uncharacterized protein n=1 Tax=Brachionus plicatilis TaxID=10195 RepID=A0A3M7QD84_BRAPC|nr:hypothetical protein BpHYR1_026821 [Brachionus plicatilis]
MDFINITAISRCVQVKFVQEKISNFKVEGVVFKQSMLRIFVQFVLEIHITIKNTFIIHLFEASVNTLLIRVIPWQFGMDLSPSFQPNY